jgi:hypothetical protein
MKRSSEVSTYLAKCPPKFRAALNALRKVLHAALPGAEERCALSSNG